MCCWAGSSSCLIFQNSHNVLYQKNSFFMCWEDCVIFSLLEPSSYSTRGEWERKKSSWQQQDGVLYIWKSHQLSLSLSLSAAPFPPHISLTALFLFSFPGLFSHVYSLWLSASALLVLQHWILPSKYNVSSDNRRYCHYHIWWSCVQDTYLTSHAVHGSQLSFKIFIICHRSHDNKYGEKKSMNK